MTAPRFDHPFDLSPVLDLLAGRRFVALTGAGCSTESGIPDYRGPETRRRARNPIQFAEYMRDDATRSRYWARSAVGWPRLRDAAPNAGHLAIAQLEQQGMLRGLITQNVDRLHQRAGSSRVIELHGALAEVVCMSCHEVESRDAFQHRLLASNPTLHILATPATLAPDGDADIEPTAPLHIPPCRRCFQGMLKPHVVFFGESVPKPVVERAFALVEEADALLVAGSSLAVYSGLRFVRRARERDIPIAMINIGESRGDDLVTAKVEAPLGEALSQLAHALIRG